MKSLWDDNKTGKYKHNVMQLRVYTSQLLGQEPDLVLHGGGNTSVKVKETNLFGESEELLYVKGSGWNLATIEAAGFAPVKLDVLKRMAELEQLSDTEMVKNQRAAMINPAAPNPSVEAILHAIIPFKYVDHTHADAVVTITNTEKGEEKIRQIYGSRVLIIPYVMPGFVLAKKVYELTRDIDWGRFEAMILLNHGVFTFNNDPKKSYERMIDIVSEAEDYLKKQKAVVVPVRAAARENLLDLARMRQAVSRIKGAALIAKLDAGLKQVSFSNLANVTSIATRGPLTPDHVIRTKPIPVIMGKDLEKDITQYSQSYKKYFERHTDGQLTCLNPAPCWAVWPGYGTVAFSRGLKEAEIISDITAHTIQAIQCGEVLGGWKALPEKDIFNVEYWELEQVKLLKKGSSPVFQGKVALVTGAASGIGRACVKVLQAQGAVVAALDINPEITALFSQKEVLGLTCDVTNREEVRKSVEKTIRCFGGLDILVSNAGMFPSSKNIVEMNADVWNRSLALNLSSHQALLQICIPYLSLGIEPAVVIIASKNVLAPGPGASAYSVAKAGLTQLARIAALELASSGIRVNIIHPDAVFDTGLWTPEVLAKRAKHYGMTEEDYKTKNLLKVAITSKDVAALACAMAGPVFSKTTGAQVPIDGGNDRVI
ncbi:MAG: bifunctional aldolase/short-chain dehydrogenase [Candidatus Omnitrophica bacterium]|nr:bifunctional aldolase/short-chain dehydrogenase [Candidatus Omnitrophota bacterium]